MTEGTDGVGLPPVERPAYGWKRSGWLALALIAIGIVLWQNWSGWFGSTPVATRIARSVEASRGVTVGCQQEGWIVFVGERTDVYGCYSAATSAADPVGCFVAVEHSYADVTKQVKELGRAGGDKFACAG